MANIKSIGGNPIVVPTAGIEDGAVTNPKLQYAKAELSAVARTAIANGSDLDDYTTPGSYKVTTAAIASSLSHCPATLAGMLDVRTSSEGARIVQEYVAINSARLVRVYLRGKGSGGMWGDWAEVMTTMNMLAAEGTSWS